VSIGRASRRGILLTPGDPTHHLAARQAACWIAVALSALVIPACRMDRAPTALEVAVNIPEAAGGTLRIIVRGQRITAGTALAPADCLCSWGEHDERRVCAFAVGKLPAGEAASDVEILDSDGRRRCYIPAAFLRRSDGGRAVLDCDAEDERPVWRAFLCAFRDGTPEAKRFVARTAEIRRSGVVRTLGDFLLRYWDLPEKLPSLSYFGNRLDALRLPVCGPEVKPLRPAVEFEAFVDGDGYRRQLVTVGSSGASCVDRLASYLVPELYYIPQLTLSEGKSRKEQLKWEGGRLAVRVLVEWQQECPKFH